MSRVANPITAGMAGAAQSRLGPTLVVAIGPSLCVLHPGRSRSALVGHVALGGLVLLALPLAAPGRRLVPAAGAHPPGWLLGPYGGGFGLGGSQYLVVLFVAFGLYLGVLIGADRIRSGILWTAIVGLVGLFVLSPPLLSADVFSYIAYGRLGAVHGLNPYAAVPADRPEDPVFPFVGWRRTPSAYGPVFTLATFPLGWISVESALWTLKVIGGLAVLGLTLITARVAALRGVDRRRAAAVVGLNPLVLVHVVGGAHNDALFMAAVMGSVALLISDQTFRASASAVVGAGLKASASFVFPFVLAASRRRWRLLAGAAAATAVIVALSWAAFGGEAASALRLVGENQAATSHYSVPATLACLTGAPLEPLRFGAIVALAVSVAWLLRWSIGGDWVRASGWAAFALLCATAWLLPWYVIWVLPLVAVTKDRPLTLAALGLCAFQLVNRVPT